jgi:integrase
MDETSQPLNQRLAEVRRARGLSARQVGAYFGVGREQVLAWEGSLRGGRPIPSRTAPLVQRWIETGEVPSAEELASKRFAALRPALSEEQLAGALSVLEEQRRFLEGALQAENTIKGYYFDWRLFCDFAGSLKLQAMPAEPRTVALFVAWMVEERGLKTTTAARRIAVVARMHKLAGFESPVTPEVRKILRGAKRSRKEKVRQVLPLSLEQLRAIARALPDTAIGARDRAIILLGFGSALRAASLAALQLEDIEVCERGLIVSVVREKNNQEGEPRFLGVPYGKNAETCPIAALNVWLAHRGREPGPLFTRLDNRKTSDKLRPLEPERICQIVQAALRRIGVDPRLYGGHSLRAGFCTAAAEAGASERQIANQTGHKDLTVLRRYFRHRDVWAGNAAAKLDL